MNRTMRVLLVEDAPEHAELIQAQLARKHGASVSIEWVSRLSAAVDLLHRNNNLDVILLDLGLPDSTIDKTLGAIIEKAPRTPIVVLSSLDDEEFGMRAVHQGAQDYICKSWMDGELLFRSLRYAIERKGTEEELRRANRIKDEFLATLSHELRTPINVIHGFAEILSHGAISEDERKKAADAILRNSKIQVSLINDMLDMSRIITGKLAVQNGVVNLSELVGHALHSVELAAQSKSIAVQTSMDPDVGVISGDPIRLHQVLWNILSNAIKFTPPGGKIDVRVHRLGGNIEIEVEDNGEGISADFIPFVFDRFSQQDASIRRHFGGLGLGLAIVKYLVELHGGKITVKSAGRGQGATFAVVLPIHAKLAETILENIVTEKAGLQPPSSVIAPPSQSAVAGDLTQPLRGLHALAIDDSADSLILTRALLQRSGAVVTTAKSAAEAHELLSREHPDVIVCDIGMPEEDGYTFLRRIRAHEAAHGEKPIPATALTAYTREEEKQQAYQAGFQAHLSKPVEVSSLVKTILDLTKPPL